jgi:hypothetical protein
VSHPYKTTGKIIVKYILVFIFLDCKYSELLTEFLNKPRIDEENVLNS